MFLLHGLVGLSVLAVAYAFYKHMSFAQVKAVVSALETVAVTDAKAVLTAIKTKL